MMTDPLPPYTVAVYKQGDYEDIAIKRLTGYWDLVGRGDFWFDSDQEMFDAWPTVEILGEGIWPQENG